MTTKPFDLARAMANGGRCQTRDGRPARIICTDRVGCIPLVVLVQKDGAEAAQYYRADGVGGCCDNDLVNIPEKRSGFANVYHVRGDVELHYHHTHAGADANANHNRIACIPIEWEE